MNRIKQSFNLFCLFKPFCLFSPFPILILFPDLYGPDETSITADGYF